VSKRVSVCERVCKYMCVCVVCVFMSVCLSVFVCVRMRVFVCVYV